MTLEKGGERRGRNCSGDAADIKRGSSASRRQGSVREFLGWFGFYNEVDSVALDERVS